MMYTLTIWVTIRWPGADGRRARAENKKPDPKRGGMRHDDDDDDDDTMTIPTARRDVVCQSRSVVCAGGVVCRRV
jgi:hypothetical protein